MRAATAWTLVTLVALCPRRSRASDGCDWTGSGLDHPESFRGVRPVYLRCSQGRVEWRYPRGALRVVLRHGTSGRDFRGCLRVSPGWAGARLYLEGRRKLHPLYAPDDGSPLDLLRCFASVDGRAALYVESQPGARLPLRRTASFSYDLRPASKRALADDMEECRPCTEAEVTTGYCTGDWVLRGTVSALDHDHSLRRTEITVRAVRVLRDAAGGLERSRGRKTDPAADYYVVHRPLKCGTRAGAGQYLFVGRWLLGYPVVTCAPRYSDWKKMRRKALVRGTGQCRFD
ncbi:meteorin-like protein [Centruroides vittatus]|uniref:meteorin-like protein n=1 Tax=Centruroides vittatus TaxID=120091 RepID=UPI00350EBC4F